MAKIANRLVWFIGISFLAAACGLGGGATDTPTPERAARPTEPARISTTAEKVEIFDSLYETIQTGYVYEDYGGVDWEGQAQRLRDQLAGGMSDEAFYDALAELVARLPDRASSFQTREQRIAAELETTAVYEGIGAFVAVRSEPVPRIILLSVIEGSPAQEAGLQAHDSIYAIDGVPVRAEEGLEAVQRVRGPEESRVLLQVASPGEVRREVTVTRRRLTATDSAKWRTLRSGAAHLLVPVVADGSLVDGVGAVLQELEAQGDSPGLILDLRIAHSTPEWPLLELLTLLTDGAMGTYYNRSARSPLVVEGQDFSNSQSVPLAILVGPDTQGLPEVFAASLQTAARATVLGLPTPGMVLGYDRTVLQDGSQLVYATSSFLTVAGLDLSQVGVRPDIQLDFDWDQVTPAVDPVLDAAESLLLSERQASVGAAWTQP